MSRKKLQMHTILDLLGEVYKYICALFLGGMVLTVFINTVLRYGFNYGLAISEEALRYLFVWLSYLGIVAVYKTKSHISVTFITDRLSKKASLYFSFFSNFLVLFAFYVLIRGGIIYMSFNINALGQMIKIPFAWIIFSVVFAGVSMTILTIIEMVAQIKAIMGREE